ncbi:DUF883 family protein [Methyloceanibacter sp.]|uniref:DUF883 family protein n=1 Tax=Methyloceanibacter sp. TaxID=1965321 RepID=UPI002D4600BA|nr:hypothetical protein [Methyloceanibacter sp.]HZP09616.1 hypothetical protein [Methyloceanibacter sp.]
MANKDAEMPGHVALKEEAQRLAKHLATLRQDVDALTAAVRSAGSHQLHRAQDRAGETLHSIEEAVQRDPWTSLGIAAGVGLLLGIVLSR